MNTCTPPMVSGWIEFHAPTTLLSHQNQWWIFNATSFGLDAVRVDTACGDGDGGDGGGGRLWP